MLIWNSVKKFKPNFFFFLFHCKSFKIKTLKRNDKKKAKKQGSKQKFFDEEKASKAKDQSFFFLTSSGLFAVASKTKKA